MDVLNINNDFSYLVTEDQRLKTELWKNLRFREKNYFHSRLYKQKIWDGFTEFFNKDTGKFLTGLLPEVRYALKHFNHQYQIIDNRKVQKWAHDKVDSQFLNQFLPKSGTWDNGEQAKPINLFDYQVDYINQVIKWGRGIVVAPTASGKTFMLVGSVLSLPPETPTLVLANACSLCDQNYAELSRWMPGRVGRIYDKYNERNFITCATVQSYHKFGDMLPHIRALFVDEIHEMMSKIPKQVYKQLKNASVRIAISATPFKFGGTDHSQKYYVKGYFGPAFKTTAPEAENGFLTTKTLQKRGNLSGSCCWIYPVREPNLQFEIYQEAYTQGIAESPYFHELVSRLVEKKCQGRTLILVERLAHGDALLDLIPGAVWVRGQDNMKTRNWVKEQLRKSDDNVVAIATQKIFNTGIDVKIHNLVNAAGGQADHQIIQRMGRGLRKADDKDILKYYDFYFYINDYLEKHSKKRVKILKGEGHEIHMMQEIDF